MVIVMPSMGHPGLSVAQKVELWQRWKQRQSLSEIRRALGKHIGSIYGVLSSNGGFILAFRKLLRWALTLTEREELSRGMEPALSILCTIRTVRMPAGDTGGRSADFSADEFNVSAETSRCGTVRSDLYESEGPCTSRAW